jgi:hypothetical protein
LGAGGFDEICQDRGSRGNVGLVYRPIWQAVEEREPAIERNAATNREVALIANGAMQQPNGDLAGSVRCLG